MTSWRSISQALERRKAPEYEKLNRVIRFALSGACRQREILRYFGEENAAALRPLRQLPAARLRSPGGAAGGEAPAQGDAERRPDRGKVLEAVRMVLSGVARTEARFPCGKNLIAQMLCGSGHAKMSKLRLDKLSTFGLLKHLKQPEVC